MASHSPPCIVNNMHFAYRANRQWQPAAMNKSAKKQNWKPSNDFSYLRWCDMKIKPKLVLKSNLGYWCCDNIILMRCERETRPSHSYSAVCSCLLQQFLPAVVMTSTPRWVWHTCTPRCTVTCIPHTLSRMCTHKQALIQWQHFTDNFPILSADPFPSCHIPHQSRSPSADTVPVTSALDLEFKQFHWGWIFHRHIMFHVLKETKELL